MPASPPAFRLSWRWLPRGLLAPALNFLLVLVLWLPLTAQAVALQLDGRAAVDVWPAVGVLADPAGTLTAAQLLGQPQRFERPTGAPGNLGQQAHPVWLRVPLQVAGERPVERVLAFDYPSLNRVDVYLAQGTAVLGHHVLGNRLAFAKRPLPSREHAVALQLPPGASELLLRVDTTSSMVLPITLRTPADFTAGEARAQLVHGLIFGVALCMLLYSLVHWASLRDSVFLIYAAMLSGNMAFMLAYFGVGAQYLWPDWPSLSQSMAPLGVLVSTAAAALFMCTTLAIREVSRTIFWLLHGCAALSLALFAAGLLGVVDYRSLQLAATVLGVGTLLLVMPIAVSKGLRGDRAARYMLLGWACFLAGATVITLLLRGLLAPSFVTQYFFPLAMMLEMATWMGVLGVRVQAIHRGADRARVESERLRTLACTDALTGLPNRRGLHEHLAAALPQAGNQQLLAIYLLDLDGFKPVNDRFGHDVGDALLVAVGRGLQAQLRGTDVVARLGGDEFVVLAGGLADEAAARRLGHKMLAAFDRPFAAAGQHCDVGLTIGYALAPLDGHCADDLIKRADAAMYAGKQAGRSCLQRGGRSSPALA